MRRRSCKLALLGLTWLGYVLQIFLVALSALWVNIGVASAGPVREMIPNPGKKYSVGENAGMSLDPTGGVAIHVAANKSPAKKDEPGPQGPPGPHASARSFPNLSAELCGASAALIASFALSSTALPPWESYYVEFVVLYPDHKVNLT